MRGCGAEDGPGAMAEEPAREELGFDLGMLGFHGF